jgi:two-component system chemotaxis sensor kinase CheA
MLKDIGVYAGATIMGDGGVALILDVIGLATRAGLLGEASSGFRAEVAAGALPVGGDRKQRVLVVGSRDDARIAMPLDHVDRLEEIPASMVERTGSQEVAQYRGGILPLVRLSRVLLERRTRPRHGPTWGPPEGDLLPVILYSSKVGSIGIVVDQIHDIVEEELGAPRPAVRPGVLFSAVLLGRVTEMLDLDWVVASLDRPVSALHRVAKPTTLSLPGAE